MHRTRTITVLAALILAGATACSSSSDSSDSKPSASATAAAGTLSVELAPKLETATKADPAVCNQVGDQACAEHLTDIALAVTDLEQSLPGAGGADAYPRTSAEVVKINAAVDAYTEHECLGDENAAITGSPCPDDAQAIMTGAAKLPSLMEVDEAKNG
ncbi:hypothetical protein [Streptomyces flaveolus]|uniref:hypothetical protein n=1 Tax=Streptomyces flaveolus TaxID=67297 RepID=UPI001670C40D|nr:hypothetical protein [Streptomyces flaveolus]GGQ83715.1 hypothetical protein GCM10010216_51970 [Streptomyces flaveolus]